jgi:hypothetical protein
MRPPRAVLLSGIAVLALGACGSSTTSGSGNLAGARPAAGATGGARPTAAGSAGGSEPGPPAARGAAQLQAIFGAPTIAATYGSTKHCHLRPDNNGTVHTSVDLSIDDADLRSVADAKQRARENSRASGEEYRITYQHDLRIGGRPGWSWAIHYLGGQFGDAATAVAEIGGRRLLVAGSGPDSQAGGSATPGRLADEAVLAITAPKLAGYYPKGD